MPGIVTTSGEQSMGTEQINKAVAIIDKVIQMGYFIDSAKRSSGLLYRAAAYEYTKKIFIGAVTHTLITNGAMISAAHTNIRIGIFSMKYGITHNPIPDSRGIALACFFPYTKYPMPKEPAIIPINKVVASIFSPDKFNGYSSSQSQSDKGLSSVVHEIHAEIYLFL